MPFNNDFPVPLAVYARAVANTHDGVWLKLLQLDHGRESHTEQGWHDLVCAYVAGSPAAIAAAPVAQIELPLVMPPSPSEVALTPNVDDGSQ